MSFRARLYKIIPFRMNMNIWINYSYWRRLAAHTEPQQKTYTSLWHGLHEDMHPDPDSYNFSFYIKCFIYWPLGA